MSCEQSKSPQIMRIFTVIKNFSSLFFLSNHLKTKKVLVRFFSNKIRYFQALSHAENYKVPFRELSSAISPKKISPGHAYLLVDDPSHAKNGTKLSGHTFPSPQT